ncbi:HhH-GPD family protein [Olsenella uli DSM 7084]|nr:HhH-GPD family protein [Olsenella uli DSM 7084]
MKRNWRLRKLIEAVGNLEYEVTGTAYNHLAHSVIERMLSMKVGHAIEKGLETACDGCICQETILSLPMEDIRTCGIAARKMPEEELAKLVDMTDDEVRASLMRIRGIGKWTVDMCLIFYLGRSDILPVEDGAIRQMFQWLYGEPITNANVR